MLKSLEYEITEDSISLTYPTARDFFFLEAIKELDFYFEVKLNAVVTPSLIISRYRDSTTPQRLSAQNGLAAEELSVGKYMDICVSDNVQSNIGDNIDSALFKIYYTAAELDRNNDGDCLDPADIDESTLCLYRLNPATGIWEKASTLDFVTGTGVITENIQPYDKSYEGYVWAEAGRFSLYALAGRARSPQPVPGISWLGSGVLVMFLSALTVWLVWRRKMRRWI